MPNLTFIQKTIKDGISPHPKNDLKQLQCNHNQNPKSKFVVWFGWEFLLVCFFVLGKKVTGWF